MRIAIAAAVVAAATLAQDSAREVVDRAADAMGGRDRILAVTSIDLQGEGTATDIGEDSAPGGDPAQWIVSRFHERIELDSRRVRVSQRRTAKFLYPDNEQWLDETRERLVETLQHPVTILRDALGGRSHATLAVDETTNLPARATENVDDLVFGRVTVETAFDGYGEVDGLKLPSHFVTTIDGVVTFDFKAATISLNARERFAGAPAATPPAPIMLTSKLLREGVWTIDGSDGYRSVVFEFADHLALFELPWHPDRSKLALDLAKTLSSKPLTQAIVPSHHPEHSGGLRAAVADGLTIVTHRDNVDYFRDRLVRGSFEAVPVGEELVLTDRSMEVQLRHVRDNPREQTNLVAYLPRHRLLIEAGLYDSQWHQHPWGPNIVWNLRGLAIDAVVPMHGPIETYAAVTARMRGRPHGVRPKF